MIFCMFGFFNVGFSCSILGQKGMLLHVFQPNLKEAEPGWFQVVPGELWNLELEILLLQIWSGILGAAIERTLWNQFSFSPVLLTEFFFYIPGGAAFLPTVGSCYDLVIWCIVDEVSWCQGLCVVNHPRFASVDLTPFFQTAVEEVLRGTVGQWWQKTNMSTLQLSWAFILVQSLEFQLERGWFF